MYICIYVYNGKKHVPNHQPVIIVGAANMVISWDYC